MSHASENIKKGDPIIGGIEIKKIFKKTFYFDANETIKKIGHAIKRIIGKG